MARDDELIKQIQQGRRECLDELVELYYPMILRYCMWHMPDRESAQDAAQETFLKLVRFIDRYHHRGQFKAFLYRIAANTCIDIIRRNPALELSVDQIGETAGYTENGFDTAENRQQLMTALSCLEESDKELVLLRYGQELTLRETASVTGLPLRTVQTRLRRAVKRMKTLFDEEPDNIQVRRKQNNTDKEDPNAS